MTSERVIEPSAFVGGYLAQLVPSVRVNARIHEDDEMFVFTLGKNKADRDLSVCSYLETGQTIAGSVREIVQWKFGGYGQIEKFLDFAAGYGRVTRFLVQEIAPERVWISDISAPAVEFQKSNLGVHGFVSVRDPEALHVDDLFDCILVCSLFSHLPEATFAKWLEKLYSLLAPHGLLIISTHDESLRGGNPSAGPASWFDEGSEISTLDRQQYGSMIVNEHFVRAAIERATGGGGCYLRIPKGLNGHQDLYLIAGEPKPDFGTLDFSFGPPGYVETVRLLESDLLGVAGWAFAPSGIEEIRLVVDGALIQKCIPSFRRPDVAAHFHNPKAELSGFSCAGRLPSNASMIAGAALQVSYLTSGGQSSIIYYNRVGSALPPTHRK